jgi:hypothetical protein
MMRLIKLLMKWLLMLLRVRNLIIDNKFID